MFGKFFRAASERTSPTTTRRRQARGRRPLRLESLEQRALLANHAPAGANRTVTMLEDSAYTFAASNFGFTDPQDSPANTLLAVKITTVPGAGALTNNGVAVVAGQSVSATDISSGRLRFTPATNANRSNYANFTFQVQDNGGTAGGGVDLDPSPNSIRLNVTAVNDAPSGSNRAVTTLEESFYTFVASDFGFNDTSDSPTNSLSAVRIATLPAAGSLTNNGVAVTAGQSIAAADIDAGQLRFMPPPNASGLGLGNFMFQVQDNGGNANGGVDLDPTPNAISVNVTSVNDSPAGADRTVITLEDTDYVFSALDFGFTDSSDSPNNSLSAVRVTALPGAGALTNDAVFVIAGQSIAVADINVGRLRFTPAANETGAGYSNFSFQLQDDGGTAGGGADLDPIPKTITFNVTAVNDAPSGADKTLTTLEDADYTFAASDFGFSDSSDSPEDRLRAVRITTLASAGVLTNHGAAVTEGESILAADVSAGLLKFTPAVDAGGDAYASFTFQVLDDGGTSNAGVDLDPTPNTILVNVTQVDDPPSGADKTVSTLEDTAYTFSVSDFGFTDPGDSPPHSLAAVTIATLPIAGTLTIGDATVMAGQSIAAADISAGRLRFAPDPNANGLNFANFDFQVQDDGGTGHGGVDLDPTPNEMNINVTAVNDLPILPDQTFEYQYREALTIATPGVLSNAHDVDSSLLAAVLVTGPVHGQLTLRGDGGFDYVADSGFSGVDHFTLSAFDGEAISLIATISLTISPQSNIEFLERTYLSLLRRPVDARGLAEYLAAMAGGLSRQEAVQSILASQERLEYSSRVVEELYRSALGRAPDFMGRAAWIDQLTSGLSREAMLAALLSSPEFLAKSPFYPTFVTGLYRAVLGREPDAGGLAYWQDYLYQGGSKEDVIHAFIHSSEYRSKNPGAFL